MNILEMFNQFRSAVGTMTEEQSAALVVRASETRAAVAPTIAGYKALAGIAESEADIYEAAGESFKGQMVAKVRNLETNASVAETGVAVQERFQVSQEKLAIVMERQKLLAVECTNILRGEKQRAIGQTAQKQLPW